MVRRSAQRIESYLVMSFAMLAIVVLSGAILVVTIYFNARSESRIRNVVEAYHLNSSMIADDLSMNAHSLMHHVETELALDVPFITEFSHAPMTGMPAIFGSAARNMQGLRSLQDQFADARFDVTVRRMQERVDAIGSGLDRQAAPEAVLVELDRLLILAQQLHRLHAIAADENLARLEASQGRLSPVLGFLMGTFLIGSALAWYVGTLFRRTLRRNTMVEDELVASRDRMHHMQKLDALGQLVGGVAHDFNNLLTAILGQTALLRSRLRDDRRAEAGLAQISQAGEQAAGLTRQLLAFSRRQPAEPRTLDLNEVVQSDLDVLRRLLPDDVELLDDCSRPLHPVYADRSQIEQVLLNLVVNARDAMSARGRIIVATDNVTLTDREVDDLPAGPYVRLSVSDTGHGIDDAVRDRLFEPFFTTKGRGQGTGLGLAMVHGIVNNAGGHIRVASRPGQGARFDIFLPASMTAAPEGAAAEDAADVSGREAVLLVEDQEAVRAYLEEGLESLGYRVAAVASGDEGLRVLHKRAGNGAVDVIVADVLMPDMNGTEFIRRARALVPDAVYIMMSGYTGDVDLARDDRGNPLPFLAKPLGAEALATVIREQLGVATPA